MSCGQRISSFKWDRSNHFVAEAKCPRSMSHAEHTHEQQASILSRALIARLSRLLYRRARGPSGGSQS